MLSGISYVFLLDKEGTLTKKARRKLYVSKAIVYITIENGDVLPYEVKLVFLRYDRQVTLNFGKELCII